MLRQVRRFLELRAEALDSARVTPPYRGNKQQMGVARNNCETSIGLGHDQRN